MDTTVSIRASSLPELFDCPARWAAKHLRGMRMPMSGKAALGKAIHASTGAFDAARVLGSPITADDAAGAAVDALLKPDEEVDWSDDSPQAAEKIARPAQQILRQRGANAGIRCRRGQVRRTHHQRPGITLTGTIDRVYRDDDGSLGIADIKSGKTAVSADMTVKTQGHGLQLATYGCLPKSPFNSHCAPARIIGMQTGATEKAQQRIAIGQIDSPRDALIGTEEAPVRCSTQPASSSLDYSITTRVHTCAASAFVPLGSTCNGRK